MYPFLASTAELEPRAREGFAEKRPHPASPQIAVRAPMELAEYKSNRAIRPGGAALQIW
jgi:hypothetical protein